MPLRTTAQNTVSARSYPDLTRRKELYDQVREQMNRLTPEQIKAALEARAAHKREESKEKKG